MVRSVFGTKKIKIVSEGLITAEEIEARRLIVTHYHAIASKAAILKPSELNVPKDAFQEKFGENWDEVIADNRLFNAMDACKELNMSAEELNTIWATAKKEGDLVKFGGGFYCGLLKVEGKPKIYTINGFYMVMRAKFT